MTITYDELPPVAGRPPGDQMMTLREAAERLRLSYWTIQRRVYNGQLPAYHVGDNASGLRVWMSDVDALLIPIDPNTGKSSRSRRRTNTARQAKASRAVADVEREAPRADDTAQRSEADA